MSSIADLWDALRGTGLETLSPALLHHGVTSLSQLVLKADDLHAAGLLRWQAGAVLAADQPYLDTTCDLPQRALGKRANLQAALEASKPNQTEEGPSSS